MSLNQSMNKNQQDVGNYNENNNQVSLSLKKTLQIPMMSRKMNHVENNINCFEKRRQSIQLPHKRQVYNSFFATPLPKLQQGDHYLKYNSVAQIDTLSRLQLLDKFQNDYNSLKKNIQNAPKSRLSPIKIYQKPVMKVSLDEVEKQLKSSKIVERGLQIPGDLYLLKKTRSRVISSLNERDSEIQKKRNESLLADKQDIIDKLVERKMDKRNKLIMSRNQHLSIYYGLYALSSKEKKKVQSKESFVQNYGF